MQLAFMTVGFLVLSVLAAGGYVVLAGPDALAARVTWESLDDLLSSVPDPSARRELARSVGARAVALEATHGGWLGRRRESLRPLWGLLALRAQAGWTALPILGSCTLCGIGLGLVRRERARADFAYCSVTWSYLGKVLFALSIAGYAATALGPVGLPVWMLYVFSASAAIGGGFYATHIPPRF